MRRGKFELTHNGTLFLDEIGDLQANLQAKLVRALQSGEFTRMGDSGYHDEEPLWSADGQKILFSRSDSAYTEIYALSSDRNTLWLMDQDGANPVQVAGPLYIEPDLIGVGRSCAFDWFRGLR